MKIIYLHQYFNTPAMSGGTRSYEMARRLVADGHEVHMVTSDRTGRGGGWTEEEIEGIHVHWCGIKYSNSLGYIHRIGAFIKFAIAAYRKACQVGGDLVFATSTPLTIALPGIFSSRALRVPFVFEVRDLWPEVPIAIGAIKSPLLKWAATRLENFAYKHSDQIIALSSGMADGIIRTGVSPKLITTIPNIADLDRFNDSCNVLLEEVHAIRNQYGDKIVLYAGTLGRINGVGYLADVANAASEIDPSLSFVVIGSGKEEADVRRRAEASGVLSKNFWMIPRVPKDQIPAYFAACRIGSSLFVDLPEMWNNSANKFFDCLASGRPVMLNYSGWQAELVRNHKIGLVVSPSDPRSAAEALCNFLDDPKQSGRAGREALEFASSNFAADTLYKDFASVLLRARHSSHLIQRRFNA